MSSSMSTCPHCACAIHCATDDPIGADGAAAAAGSGATNVVLSLLGGFTLQVSGRPVTLQPGAQRLLAYAALQNRPLARSVMAGTLWPDTDDTRAAASLRSALWRLRTVGPALLHVDQATLALGLQVDVDVRVLRARARRLLEPPADAPQTVVPGGGDATLFTTELLPGWWDEWVIAERERLRILQLAALEEVGARLIDHGLYPRALDVCLRLAEIEPLRESTHRLVIRAHLLQGNHAEALQHYFTFRELLWNELGIPPSAEMDQLLATAHCTPRDVGPHGRRPRRVGRVAGAGTSSVTAR